MLPRVSLARPSPLTARGWVASGALAFAFSSAHFVLDWHIGLFGDRSDAVSPLQAVLVWLVAGLGALWLVAFAAAGRDEGWGFALLVPLSIAWAVGGNGIPILFCPPPCAGAFPHQDIAHLGSLAFGILGAITAWRAGRRIGMSGRSVAAASVALVAVLAIIFWAQVSLM